MLDRVDMIDHGLDAIGTSADWLRAELSAAGVRLHPNSELARALNDLDRLATQIGQVARFPSASDAQSLYLSASGVDFLSKALRRGRAHGLAGFGRHMKALGSGNPLLTGPAEKASGDRDATWELLLAALVASFSSNVREEEPPDITCDFVGARIGIAAKVLHSTNRNKLPKHVVKGAEQLERSMADHGFVAINLADVFPHAKMFENFRSGRIASGDAAQLVINEWMNAFLATYNVPDLVRRLAATPNSKLNSVMFFVPTVLHIEGIDPSLVPFYRFHMITVDGRRERAEAFEHALNWSCQDVLGYRGM